MNKPHLIHTFIDPYIAAASGLALVENNFYVVSDDELTLIKMSSDFKMVEVISLFEGSLPEEVKARKKIKPDLETITYIESARSLLTLPSGSKNNRTKGALIGLDGKVEIKDFTKVYSYLTTQFSELNIEGAVILQNSIRLLQRGNGQSNENALIDLNLDFFLSDQIENLSIQKINLGSLNDCPLSFTDGFLYEGKLWFLAVAEATESTYLDGDFLGAILGCIEQDGTISKTINLDLQSKPEGLVIHNDEYYVVTDDDDRSVPSKLFKGLLP